MVNFENSVLRMVSIQGINKVLMKDCTRLAHLKSAIKYFIMFYHFCSNFRLHNL